MRSPGLVNSASIPSAASAEAAEVVVPAAAAVVVPAVAGLDGLLEPQSRTKPSPRFASH
jgi:hypothetical protein